MRGLGILELLFATSLAGGWVQDGNRYVYVHGRWVPPGTPRQGTYVHPRPVTVRVRPGATYQARPPRPAMVPSNPRRRDVTPMTPH